MHLRVIILSRYILLLAKNNESCNGFSVYEMKLVVISESYICCMCVKYITILHLLHNDLTNIIKVYINI